MNEDFKNKIILFCEKLPATFKITSEMIKQTGIEELDDEELLLFLNYVGKELESAEGYFKDQIEALEAEINFIFEAREREYKIL
jgi:hypothetical protein